MRKLILILPIALLLAGCALEEMQSPVQKADSKAFSIEEAKEFFEKDFATALTKTSSGSRKQGKLNPGDFTPLWDKAVYSEKGGTAAIPVAGAAGVLSGIFGLASTGASLLSYSNIPAGLYVIETTEGSCVYIYINDTITV